jgi:hypothetical protein
MSKANEKAKPSRPADGSAKTPTPDGGERPRTWGEEYGGTMAIIGVFVVVIALIVVKNACG